MSHSFSHLATAFSFRWNATAITVAGVTGTVGTGSNQLDHPLCITISSSNELYVVDNTNHRVQKWVVGSSSGTTVAGQATGVIGSGLSYLNYPSDVVIGPGNKVYVVDLGNSRVVSWSNGSSSGTLLAGTGKGILKHHPFQIFFLIRNPKERVCYFLCSFSRGGNSTMNLYQFTLCIKSIESLQNSIIGNNFL